jgi:DeoR family transcriptional regulator, aga operon transcriptional repressor
MGFLVQGAERARAVTMFKTVERNLSLTDRTERQIKELIADQSLRFGERLPPQDELAKRLGVSRTVIREAMRLLVAKGLLEGRKGSGIYVRRAEFGLPAQAQGADGTYSPEDKPKTESAGSQPRAGAGHLLPEERRRRVVEMLHHTECITVSDLVERFGVSRVTARADLDYLAGQGALVRSHGGALKNMDPRSDYPLQLKQTLHHAEKVRIASAAVKLLNDGDTIAFDSGTTTCEIAKQIARLNLGSLTVITNALNIANELSSLPWVTLIMTGGILRHKSSSFNGPHALETLRDLNVGHLFLGADAIDIEAGLTTPDILGAQVALRMIELAREVTVVVDASKFGRHSLTLSGKTEDIDRVITDARVSATHVESLRQRGVEVIIV